MKKLLKSEIFRKIFFAMLFLAVVPALILGWLAIAAGNQAGALSTSLSQTALDAKSQEMLEIRAVTTAAAIASFLEEREADLNTLALMPKTEQAYLAFYQQHTSEIWGLEDSEEYRRQEPLYTEVAWVDADGREALKVQGGKAVAAMENSRYPAEDWFSETVGLPPGEIYVGHLNGYFLTRQSYETGGRYDGIFRFAQPVYDEGGALLGAVTLALDYRHVAEFAAHIVPDETRFAAVPDASSGSYAYLIDDLGWTISHPNQFYQFGFGSNGESLDYVSAVEQIGSQPIRLDRIGFLDENLASIPSLVANGNVGSLVYTWQEQNKFVAYAPVPYYGGDYTAPTGFGWIGIGAEVNNFHLAANQVGSAIESRVKSLMWGILVVLVGGGLVSVPVAMILARGVAAPVQRLIQAAQKVERAESDLDVLDPLLESTSQGEMATLARVFKRMAEEVYLREKKLRETIFRLRIEIDDTRKQKEVAEVVETKYFQTLQERVRDLKKNNHDEQD